MPSRSIDVKSSILCVKKASNTLNWSPNTSLEEGLELTAKWWIENYRSNL
jgi:nucleoside-diphosphate-sugar epimerase